jgi:signal transduction histidine kinase
MLSFSRVDNSAGCPTSVHDIVDGCVSLVRTVMRHDRIALSVVLPEGLPLINCRSQQIQQVIMNLLTNARDAVNLKFATNSMDKKITIHVSLLEDGASRMIRISVEDNGPGIPRELHERIFEPFFTTKDRTKGTGLGLSISHSIVRDNGGKLSVESEMGLWTKFHVDFPAVEAVLT